MSPELKKHVIDIIKGAFGAALTAALLALIQYLGAHIPGFVDAAAPIAGGVVAVKTKLG